MSDIAYIERKFTSLVGDAQQEIAKARSKAVSEAVLRGAATSSRMVFLLQDLTRNGFRDALRKMAKILIDLDAQGDAPAHAAFSKAASALVAQLVPAGSFALGKGAFQLAPPSQVQRQEEAFRAELAGLAQAVLDDARHGIVGDQAHRGDRPQVSVAAHNAAVATGRGAVAQAGDHAQQLVQQGKIDKLQAIIAELMKRLPPDQAETKIKAEAVEDAITTKSPDRIRQTVDILRGALGKMSDAGLAELGKKLGDWLGG